MVTRGGERFGEVLRRARREAGLSQEELAERAGLSARGISDLERGARTTPQRATARMLAAALHLEPEAARVFEAAARGAEGSASANGGSAPSALPAAIGPLIGREEEVAELVTLLQDGGRLVTLTGPGGAGKTTLALEVARRLEGRGAFPDGVTLVELAALSDPALVSHTVADALGVAERAGQAMEETLALALREGRRLLVLDNCEHLIEMAAQLAGGLLPAGEGLRILATSREALAVRGETVFRVPPLAVPPLEGVRPAQLDVYAATRLFLERAAQRGERPQTRPTEGEMGQTYARAVAQICHRLDGLPLAIELAAARVGALGVVGLASRLEASFQLLGGSDRSAPPRHQTLRATVDWSYELLSEPERALFRRLAVFAGGFTLEAAEAVCDGSADGAHGAETARGEVGGGGPEVEGLEVAGRLGQLVDKSLVVAEASGGSVRYRMLETLRVFARERLRGGEEETTAARHAVHYLTLEPALAREVTARLERGLPAAGLDPERRARFGREMDNLRAALRWCLEHGDVERALLVANGPLWVTWSHGGHYAEARRWTEALLRSGTDVPRWLRAAGHATVGLCAHFMGDEEAARTELEASVGLSREVGAPRVDALSVLGMARWLDGDDAGAEAAIREGLAGAEEAGDALAASRALRDLSFVARTQGDFTGARGLLDRSMAALRAQEDLYPGHYVRSLSCLGRIAWLEGKTEEAARELREALRRAARDGAMYLVPDCLEWLAPILAEEGRTREAAQLLGAAEAGRRVTDRRRYRRDEPAYERDVARIREGLGEDALRAARAEGEQLTLDEATAIGLRAYVEATEER